MHVRSIALWMLVAALVAAQDWKPVQGRIVTRWAADVRPGNAWPEYPRPQMVREQWRNLNGLWDYAIVGEGGEWTRGRVENANADLLIGLTETGPPHWDGKILVPFAVESALSGVGKLVRPGQTLWYRRAFEVPAAWSGKRVRLNFEAVDWHAHCLSMGSESGRTEAVTRGSGWTSRMRSGDRVPKSSW